MVFFELPLHRSVMELDIAVGKCRERGRYSHQALSALAQAGKARLHRRQRQ